jgi:serine protease AprX
MNFRLYFSSLFCFLFAQLTAQADWSQKVDPELLLEVQNGVANKECLVVMKTQADLSGAENRYTKAAKGKFVFETLSAHAAATQKPLIMLLEKEQKAYRSFWIVNALWTVADMALLQKIAQLESVDHIETNPVWRRHPAPNERKEIPQSVAQDRNTPISWGLTKINAPAVWAMGIDGTGVTVGGQDTGYEWEHPAIKPKYRGWNGSTANHNYNWHDAIHAQIGGGTNSCGLDKTAPCDDSSHGTHTMGTMVGAPNMDSIIGVAPGARWIGCRNMETGDGTPATYIECFEWFLAPTNLANGMPNTNMSPHVINNSWGCPVSEGCNSSNFAVMNTVVNNCVAAGIVVVVSAGNSGSGCSSVDSPAAIFQNSYTVGATNSSDAIAGFSSRGPATVFSSPGLRKPDIAAPGVGIPSCVGNSNNYGSFTYGSSSGTSMAGPHVAGLVALVIQARPALAGSVSMIRSIIDASAVKLFASSPFCGSDNGSTTPNNVFGAGRINALAAVQLAQTIALPVEISDFEVKKSDKEAIITWKTGLETDCAEFQLERSANSRDWETIGTVTCAGANYPYQFMDAKPLKKTNYYRLRQVDFSGETSLSVIRALSFADNGLSLNVAPLYAEGNLAYDLVGASAEDVYQIQIYNISGRLLANYQISEQGELLLPDLARGIYVATLQNKQGSVVTSARFVW